MDTFTRAEKEKERKIKQQCIVTLLDCVTVD